MTLNLDLKQMGVGGDNSWGARPHDEFRISSAKPYSYVFCLRPFHTKDADIKKLTKRVFPIPSS